MSECGRERQSCRHLGKEFLRARGLRAGRASARARLRRIAVSANCLPSKARAFIAGYNRGYRAAYKRHYEHVMAIRRVMGISE